MTWFTWGLLIGWGSSLLVAGVIALYAYRRLVVLERRTRHAERLAELGTLTGGLHFKDQESPYLVVSAQSPAFYRRICFPRIPLLAMVNRLTTVRNETVPLARKFSMIFYAMPAKLELDRKSVRLNGLLEDLVDFFTPGQAHRVHFASEDLQAIQAPIDARLIEQRCSA